MLSSTPQTCYKCLLTSIQLLHVMILFYFEYILQITMWLSNICSHDDYLFSYMCFACAACELKTPSMNSFLNGLDSSGWLRHVRSILEPSLFIASAIEAGVSVVVHCSDGWDRTAQVCAVACLLLDSYYRTVQGFQVTLLECKCRRSSVCFCPL